VYIFSDPLALLNTECLELCYPSVNDILLSINMEQCHYGRSGMDQVDFLDQHGNIEANASIRLRLQNELFTTIDHLSLEVIEESCPLLAAAFEPSRQGMLHCIDDSSPELVVSLLRWAYTGEYIPSAFYGDESLPLTFHLRLYRLAQRYDISALQLNIRGRILMECELACSNPRPPLDLVDSIRYLYDHLPDQQDIISTITHYCVSCFFLHGLNDNPHFLLLAYEYRQFHSDLCKANMDRAFQDQGESAYYCL